MPCKTDVAVAHATGIDTGKNTLHMIGLDEKGAIVLREKVSRNRIAARLVTGSKPAWPRTTWPVSYFALGTPAYAKPFRQGHKNDFRDAHAIAEAVQCSWPNRTARAPGEIP